MKTGRPRKLDDTAEELVRMRVTIAKETRIFSEKELAAGFSIGIMTLRRYYIPKEREASQVHTRKAYELRRGEDRSNCDDCSDPIISHQRCKDCRILIHSDPVVCRCGEQHGLTLDGLYCTVCINSVLNLSNGATN